MNTWHIIRHGEECECEECGYPLYTGDSAYYTDDYGHVFCGKACAKQTSERMAS
jgi:hypothetical protein